MQAYTYIPYRTADATVAGKCDRLIHLRYQSRDTFAIEIIPSARLPSAPSAKTQISIGHHAPIKIVRYRHSVKFRREMWNARCKMRILSISMKPTDLVEWTLNPIRKELFAKDLPHHEPCMEQLAELARAANSANSASSFYENSFSSCFTRRFIKQTVHSLRASGKPEVSRDFVSRACAATHGFCNFRYNLSYFRRFLRPLCLTGNTFPKLNFCTYALLNILKNLLNLHILS